MSGIVFLKMFLFGIIILGSVIHYNEIQIRYLRWKSLYKKRGCRVEKNAPRYGLATVLSLLSGYLLRLVCYPNIITFLTVCKVRGFMVFCILNCGFGVKILYRPFPVALTSSFPRGACDLAVFGSRSLSSCCAF